MAEKIIDRKLRNYMLVVFLMKRHKFHYIILSVYIISIAKPSVHRISV